MNRSLPSRDRGRRSPHPCRAFGFARTLLGVGGLVRRTAAAREGTAAMSGLKVIKHGGFERFLLETLCASDATRCS